MNLNQLKFAKAVAETKSFSKAAELCFVTQPTLSNGVSNLEDELGGRLFMRTTRKVSLTPFGELVLPMIQAILEAQDDLLKASKAYFTPSHQLLRVGFSPLVNVRLLNTVLSPYIEKNPKVEIVYKECVLNDLHDRLTNHTVDVIITLKELVKRNMCRQIFYKEELYYIPNTTTGEGNQIIGPVQLTDVIDQTYVVTKGCGLAQAIRKLFKAHGAKLKEYKGQALHYAIAEQWAELGIGATILPKSKISPNCWSARQLMLGDMKIGSLTFVAAWSKDVVYPVHVQELIRHFKEVVPVIVKGLADEYSHHLPGDEFAA